MGRTSARRIGQSLAVLATIGLLATGCGRSSDEKATGTTAASGTPTTAGSAASDRLDQGDFGTLKKVCASGSPSGASDKGVSASSIQIGVVTDKGSDIRPGLNKEMYDSAVAFSKWCNSHGGINGRKIELTDLDAKLFNYPSVITKGCQTDFMMVGGGAAIDDGDKGARVKCGLANIAGYAVSDVARTSSLQVMPLPSPVDKVQAGPFRVLAKLDPEAVKHFGTITGDLASIKISRDQDEQAAESAGFKSVYNDKYAAAGESNWLPFVDKMKRAGVQVLELVGEPSAITGLQKAMSTEGWYPKYTIEASNFYDSKFAAEGGSVAKNTYVRLNFTPLEEASTDPATADYLEMMKRYNPSGKKALLGLQAMSAWLLFATSANQCGNALTRDCVMAKAGAVTSWTAGGLNAATDPSTNTPAQCFLSVKVTSSGFTYDKATTDPNKGLFNCDPANVAKVSATD
ncbi:MAG TPA: ABC transporter substrate-binding protein [Acidimicrobiales bacterium]